jgi:hypothetical protein
MKELTACAIALMLGSPSLAQSSCEPMGFTPVAFIASGQTVEDVALFDPVTGYYLEIADWELDGVFDVDEDLLIADLELGALSGAVIIVRPGVTLTSTMHVSFAEQRLPQCGRAFGCCPELR